MSRRRKAFGLTTGAMSLRAMIPEPKSAFLPLALLIEVRLRSLPSLEGRIMPAQSRFRWDVAISIYPSWD